eukprot:5172177-Pyramimonas_sp.AAC.1
MQQTNAPDYSASVSVRISSVAAAELEFSTEYRQFRDDSGDTNSFADLARVADRVQTSACDRQTRLMSLHRFL